jgi:hypothetical protein
MVALAKHARTAGMVAIVAGLGTAVGYDAAGPATTDVSLFTISKSENKNEVQYAIRVDDHCAPAEGEPIWAYWRMLERGPTVTEPLLRREQAAYGLASQSVSERTATGGRALLTLRAVAARPVAIDTFRAPSGECQARSTATIGGESAFLFNVYVKLRWPAGVSYILLQGWSSDRTRIVTEKIE